ncbi:hypothetical protein FRB95_002599 [Tulasnella sp. JGI-2019a]|nr:hypothetical protein FRB95_002599 [Tulasnella sp. JGI-2019a]
MNVVSSQTRQKYLPYELISNVVYLADPDLLTAFACTCYALQVEAERLLYRTLIIDDVYKLRSVHNALLAISRRQLAVQSLSVKMRRPFINHESVEYCLRSILSLTENLTSFETQASHQSIFQPPFDTLYTFCLRKLATDITVDSNLVEFLASQTEIEDLELSRWSGEARLPNTALPKLGKVTGAYEAISYLVPGRATIYDVTAKRVERYLRQTSNDSPETLLVALSQATGRILRLRFNIHDIQGLRIRQIGQALPFLTELTLHTTLHPTNEIRLSLNDHDWMKGLRHLEALRHLRISVSEAMALPLPSPEAEAILNGWKAVCPSLEYVIFSDNGEWECINEGGWRMSGVCGGPDRR